MEAPEPLNPPVLPQDRRELAVLVRQLCAELRKNPAYAWMMTQWEEKRQEELGAMANESVKRKVRDRATFRFNLLTELVGWMEDQDREAIKTLEA